MIYFIYWRYLLPGEDQTRCEIAECMEQAEMNRRIRMLLDEHISKRLILTKIVAYRGLKLIEQEAF